MNKDETINEIIDNLIDGSKNGYIKWSFINKPSNGKAINSTRNKFHYISDDKATEFKISIELNPDLSSMTNQIKYLYIYNKYLINACIQLSSNDYEEVDTLAKFMYHTHIQPNVSKSKANENVLDDILSGINKQHQRESKIGGLLNLKEGKPTPPPTQIIQEGKDPKPPQQTQSKNKKRSWYNIF